MSPVSVARSLDLKGLACPLPIAKTAQVIREILAGDAVEVFTTDPGSVHDFEAWCRSTGNDLVESSREAGVFRFLVVKG